MILGKQFEILLFRAQMMFFLKNAKKGMTQKQTIKPNTEEESDTKFTQKQHAVETWWQKHSHKQHIMGGEQCT